MTILRIDIETEQPVLATALQGDPNSTSSYPYLPGSMIRGACIAAYMRAGNPVDAADADCRRLFFDTTTRYLNAYPVLDDRRTVPTPLTWRYDATSANSDTSVIHGVNDLAHLRTADEPRAPTKTKSLHTPFYCADETQVRAVHVHMQLNVHNTRNRIRGRAIKPPDQQDDVAAVSRDVGAVFRYEAIAPGQTFRSVVVCATDADAQTLLHGLQQREHIWLGRSRSAGYGRVRLNAEIVEHGWEETGQLLSTRYDQSSQTANVLHVTALSDIMLRDDQGHYTFDLTPTLEDAIQIKPLKLDRYWTDWHVVGGFNRTWGLPLPQVPVIAQGSVLVVQLPDTKAIAELLPDLQRLETDGIGEQRSTGYGRIAFFMPLPSGQATIHVAATSSTVVAAPSMTETDLNLARRMAERHLRQHLDQCLLELAKTHTIADAKTISNSQLSRIWIAARRGIDDLRALLNPESLTHYAREQLERTRVTSDEGTQSLRFWLNNRVENPTQLWTQKEITLAGQTVSITDNDNALAREYTARLVMAVMKNTRKERRND